MPLLGKSPFDDASGLAWHLVPNKDAQWDIGNPTARIRNIYVEGSVIGAVFDLANNQYLQSENAAGSGLLKLLKADASDNTVLNALTGKVIDFDINEVVKAALSATAFTLSAGVSVIAPTYNLSDGSDKNHNVSTFASGTAYTLTNTSTALTFGTSSPTLVLDKAGTYLIIGRTNLEMVGATFAANRNVTLKLRRTNNTPADLTGGTTVLGTGIVTTVSQVLSDANLPAVFYTTTNTNDIVTIFGDVSVVPTAGSLQATEASILAVRLF